MSTTSSSDLSSLRIDRGRKAGPEPSKWSTRWIIAGVLLFALLGAGRVAYTIFNSATEVEVVRVRAMTAGDAAAAGSVVLNATGYIIAAHKIELASKVVGKVDWIGVEKGDRVRKDQELVRLEDDEYRAQVQQARGSLANLEARLAELENGSRPEEIARAKADVATSRADLDNARITLDRTRQLVKEGVLSRQSLDDAVARYDAQAARTASAERTFDLVRIGPRQEQIAAVRGQIEQARGVLALAETQLTNTIIRAPVSGTILERNVERGEFVTTGFVGDRGAKGYVVSIADLRDLQVELDINQNDFAKLDARQKGIVTTDAYPDRKYEGLIEEMSPEANRQKATVQVKVKVLNPDEYLRPEMNASVAFLAKEQPRTENAGVQKPVIVVPASAIRDNSVFIVADGRAVRRTVKTGGTGEDGVRIEQGLNGGEDVIVNPPAELKDGSKVKTKS
jgi:HlyD family secretion protein